MKPKKLINSRYLLTISIILGLLVALIGMTYLTRNITGLAYVLSDRPPKNVLTEIESQSNLKPYRSEFHTNKAYNHYNFLFSWANYHAKANAWSAYNIPELDFAKATVLFDNLAIEHSLKYYRTACSENRASRSSCPYDPLGNETRSKLKDAWEYLDTPLSACYETAIDDTPASFLVTVLPQADTESVGTKKPANVTIRLNYGTC